MNPRTATILALAALAVGAAGLVFGISAKNGNKSDEEIADQVKTELESQLGSTASEEQSQEEAQATTEAGQTESLDKQVAELTEEVSKLQTAVNNLNEGQSSQVSDIQTLTNEISKLTTRLNNLESK